MSKREKHIVLFSRNGIKIERIDHLDMTKRSNTDCVGKCFRDSFQNTIKVKEIIQGTPAWTEKIKIESPLGFYYYKEINHPEIKPQIISDHAYFVTYISCYDDKRYILTYPKQYKDITINKETRPWDILPGYKGIPDHFIQDLYKELNKMFNIWEDERLKFRIEKAQYNWWGNLTMPSDKFTSDLSWINQERKKIFLDIFGNENGLIAINNNIDILRHGFDLKESFRKRKES